MKKQELIETCEDAEKSIEITSKLLHLFKVIVAETKKFLSEIDFGDQTSK